jgi:hypothetical protein
MFYDEELQPRAETLKLIGRKLAPACVRRKIERQVQVAGAARTDMRHKMHRETAGDGVAWRDVRRIEMG